MKLPIKINVFCVERQKNMNNANRKTLTAGISKERQGTSKWYNTT